MYAPHFAYIRASSVAEAISLLGQHNDAKLLANFCKVTPCKVNLIEFNPTGDGVFNKSSKANTEAFFNFLEMIRVLI